MPEKFKENRRRNLFVLDGLLVRNQRSLNMRNTRAKK